MERDALSAEFDGVVAEFWLQGVLRAQFVGAAPDTAVEPTQEEQEEATARFGWRVVSYLRMRHCGATHGEALDVMTRFPWSYIPSYALWRTAGADHGEATARAWAERGGRPIGALPPRPQPVDADQEEKYAGDKWRAEHPPITFVLKPQPPGALGDTAPEKNLDFFLEKS